MTGSPDPATTHSRLEVGRGWPPRCADHGHGRRGCPQKKDDEQGIDEQDVLERVVFFFPL